MESTYNKVCFVLTHVPNPRMNKRISEFKQIMSTEVICARRASQNIWEPEHTDINHTILNVDLPESSHIFKRSMVSLGFRKTVYSLLEEKKPSIVYAEGLDVLMVASKYKKKYGGLLIYEVSDLRESFIEKPQGIIKQATTTVIACNEKRLFKDIDKLVITSPKFYDMHYCKLIAKSKTVYVPNAPDLRAFRNFKRKEDGKFTVGFIGGIRYITQMRMLVNAASELDINVIFAGAGGTSSEYSEIKEYCKGNDNIRFTGRYDYWNDIANLYGMVDCVYSVYNADNPNVCIALPNKLYEAVYCGLPIIVAKKTYLEEITLAWGVGVSVGHENEDELKKALQTLRDSKDYYDGIVAACEKRKTEIEEMRKSDLVASLLKE